MMAQNSPIAPQPARSQKTSARRGNVMAAALDVFLEQGVEDARIEDICKLSGTSVGSIYHHFGNKKSLADAVYIEALSQYLTALDGKLIGEPTAKEFFYIIVSHHLSWVRNNRKWAQFLLPIRRNSRSKELKEKVAQLNDKYLQKTMTLLKEYARRGEIRKLPRYLYAPLIMGPCQDLVRQYLENRGGGIPDDVAEIVADVIWQGLKG